MLHGNGKLPQGTYLNWWTYPEKNPDGRILVMDEDQVYGYGLKPKYHTWSSTFLDYQLFSVNKKIETKPVSPPTIFGPKRMGRTPTRQLKYNWTLPIPLYVRAMVMAADKLIVCGPEDIVDEKAAVRAYRKEQMLETLKRQDAILEGKQGSHLWVVRAGNGQILEKLTLPTLPVWDGMATAGGRVYLAVQGGIVCLGGK
jgi:hypothetical protein